MVSAASRRLLRELPTQEEMSATIVDLKTHGHVATALLGAAYLEKALENILKAKFVTLTKDDDNRLFDGSAGGILGGFAAKIRIAYAINILGPVSYHDLLLINDIRNVFAHSLHKVTFVNELIASDCRKLKFHDHFYQITSKTLADILAMPTDPLDIFSETIFSLYVAMINLLIQSHSSISALPAHQLDSMGKQLSA